jgi:hypothetical protein
MGFLSNFKNELVRHRDFVSRDATRIAIIDYFEPLYNRKRMY